MNKCITRHCNNNKGQSKDNNNENIKTIEKLQQVKISDLFIIRY